MKNKILIYYISTLLMFIASSLFTPISYIFYVDRGLSLYVIGMSISILWVISGLFEVPLGIFADRYGTRFTMILSTTLSILGLGLLIIGISRWKLLFCSAIFGIASAANSGCLSSWIVNSLKEELKDSFDQAKIQKIFSYSNISCSIVSLIFSFLVLQVIYSINAYYPIYLSFMSYIICLLFFTFIFKEGSIKLNKNNENFQSIISGYLSNIDKNFLLISLFFSIPFIMDIGPVNQWSIVYRETNILGFIQIMIVGAVVIGNWIISKFKISQFNIVKFIVIDAIIIVLLKFIILNNVYIALLLFILHVIVNIIILNVNLSYLHSDVIQDNKNRNAIISTFNFFSSCIVGILLTVQGYFSNIYGITNTWLIFSIVGAVIYLVMYKQMLKFKGGSNDKL